MEAPEQDHYAILGVEQSATAAQIKLAYHRLAMQTHPDKHENSEESTAAFQKLQKASEILLDPARRRVYDIKYHVIKADWAAAKENAEASQQAKRETQRQEPQRPGPSNKDNRPRRQSPKFGSSPPGSSSSSSSRPSCQVSEDELTDDEYSEEFMKNTSQGFGYEGPFPDPRYEDGRPYTGGYYNDPPSQPRRPQTRRDFTDQNGYRQEHPQPRSSSPRTGPQPHRHGNRWEYRREVYSRDGAQTRSQHHQQRSRAQQHSNPFQSDVDREQEQRIRDLAVYVRGAGTYIGHILDDAADEIAWGVLPGDLRIINMLARVMREVGEVAAKVGRVKEDMER